MKRSTTSIGLNASKSEKLATKLNTLLANYQLFYINTRGFHWNIKGDNFFELHLKFEEIYNNLQLKIDEIAERILTLGYTPLHSYSAYLKNAGIKEKNKHYQRETSAGRSAERPFTGYSAAKGIAYPVIRR